MPLDTGAFTEVRGEGSDRRPRLVLDPHVEIGAALKAAREQAGLSLDEISEITRVRSRHLANIEAAEIDQLPSRPFTIGYVRAYAKALGLDADATAARFRTEHPSPDDALQTPVGVKHNRAAPRSRWMVMLAGVALVAVVGWNVTVRLMAAPPPKHAPPAVHITGPAKTNALNGPFTVDSPLPAPPEATAPPTYQTPIVGNDAPATPIVGAQDTTAAAATAGAPFVPQGKMLGQTAGASDLIIQAKKSISLEIRGPNNAIYFAGQLAAGDAYRVPNLPGLTAEVSNPASA